MTLSNSILMLWVVLAGSVWGLIGVSAISRRPIIAFDLIFAGMLINAVTVVELSFSLGSLQLYYNDVVFSFLLTVVFYNLLLSKNMSVVGLMPIALMMILVYGFTQGASAFGVNAAGVDARRYFYFFSGLIFLSALEPTIELFHRIAHRWIYYSVALLALAIFRWIAGGIGLGIADQWQQISESTSSSLKFLRVLTADEALFLLESLFFSLMVHLTQARKTWLSYVWIPSGIAIVLLQHRSIWVAAACALICMWFTVRGTSSAFIRPKLMYSFLLIVALGSAWLLIFGRALLQALDESASNRDTFEWRLEGWQSLLLQRQTWSPIEKLFGAPFGSGYERYVEGYLIEVSPHNYYLQILLRLGIVGLAALLALYAIAFQRLIRERRSDHSCLYPQPVVWIALLVAQLIYFVPYTPAPSQAILLGSVLALAGKQSVQSHLVENRDELRESYVHNSNSRSHDKPQPTNPHAPLPRVSGR